MKKKVLVVLADGFEDIEAVTPIDMLTRAGVEVTIAGLKGGPVKAAYGTTIVPHTTIEQINGLYDGIVLPGGADNAESLAAHPKVIDLVRKHHEAGKLVGAICASPGQVLAEAAGILRAKNATGAPLPEYNERLAAGGAQLTDQPVTVDGNIVTAMGPGAALQFGLTLAEYLTDRATVDGFAKKWRVKW
jgi:4-methyl-5(b-hydroxyethyl)-thiazole monophosphate biosynthesis